MWRNAKGELGYWDRRTNELTSESNENLATYHNEYCGYDNEHIYLAGSNLESISMSDLSKKTLIRDIESLTFKTNSHNTQGYLRVSGGILYDGQQMYTAPISDLNDHTYYGSPDGQNGGLLFHAGDGIYMILTDGSLWHWKK